MDSRALGLYVAASLALIATPGQDMLYVVSRALAQGRLAAVCSALGVSLGILVHTGLAALGVAALLRAYPSLFLALRVAGALYLVYLGARMIATGVGAGAAGSIAPAPLATLVGQGMLSNLGNPKILLFFVAFLPQFVEPGSPHAARELALLGVLYAALAFPVKAAVGVGAAMFARRLGRWPRAGRWIGRASGAILIALGVRLAGGR